MTAAAVEVSDDAFLGGRLRLLQPRSGYRAGLDALLLAAAVPPVARLLDAGAGVGAAGLAAASRLPGLAVVLVEREAALARLAAENVRRNGLEERVRVVAADLTGPAADQAALGLAAGAFDHVIANPPYQDEGSGRRPGVPLRAAAREMPAGGLARWVRFLARMAAPGGGMTIIHRAAALGDLLAALEGRFGALSVLPVHPREGADATRIILSGRKGSRAPLGVRPGLVVHRPDGRFLPAVEAILRDGASLPAAD
jgi:tRNA1(Val) A37 N6-methylase TrmN6